MGFAQIPGEFKRPSPIAQALGMIGQTGLGALEQVGQQRQQAQQQNILSRVLAGKATPEEMGKLDPQIQLEAAKQMSKEKTQSEKSKLIERLFGRGETGLGLEQGEEIVDRAQPVDRVETGLRELSDEQLAALSLQDPQTAKLVQSIQKERRRGFQEERAYHATFTKDLEKKIENLREILPRKENALDFARQAVESGEVGRFSKDQFANAVGGEFGNLLRTAEGAELITASKENLLTNMSRVSAKAQNVWFEQKLNTVFPQIGQSEEANLTTQEMIESEVALDKAQVKIYDQLAEQDEKKFGYVRKDIGRRVDSILNDMNKQIFNRATYRMKEIEEKDKKASELKKQVGKKVPKGTQLTLAMGKLYLDKFGDKAEKTAEQNGYVIPKVSELRTYQLEPREFREIFGL